MPVHDWTRVDVEVFHDFQIAWVTHLKEALNGGLLPEDHYAHCEPATETRPARRTLAVRHVSGHRVVALVEILSPGNKDRAANVEDFVDKVDDALRLGIHVLLVDLFPPGPYDPRGVHGTLWERYDLEPYDLPADEPLTLASYRAGPAPEAFVDHLATAAELPDMPLFLDPSAYIPLPLELSYRRAYLGLPGFWKGVIEA